MCRFCGLLYTIRTKAYKVVRRFLRAFSALIDPRNTEESQDRLSGELLMYFLSGMKPLSNVVLLPC